MTAVNWGQGHGPYSLPPERLLLCASGSSFLWRQDHVTDLSTDFTKDLLPSLLKLWPLEDRGGHEGSFIWILDEDYSLIIAPMMQRRETELVEVKHGDLVPGETFFGPNGVRGAYRGLARMGGEFNLAGNRNGSEWVMHAKSGYTAYRVPVAAAKDYYHVQIQVGFILLYNTLYMFRIIGFLSLHRTGWPERDGHRQQFSEMPAACGSLASRKAKVCIEKFIECVKPYLDCCFAEGISVIGEGCKIMKAFKALAHFDLWLWDAKSRGFALCEVTGSKYLLVSFGISAAVM